MEAVVTQPDSRESTEHEAVATLKRRRTIADRDYRTGCFADAKSPSADAGRTVAPATARPISPSILPPKIARSIKGPAVPR
jgi:hypothetical protein